MIEHTLGEKDWTNAKRNVFANWKVSSNEIQYSTQYKSALNYEKIWLSLITSLKRKGSKAEYKIVS